MIQPEITVRLMEADGVTPIDVDPIDVTNVQSVAFEDPIGVDGSYNLVLGLENRFRYAVREEGRVLEWLLDGTPVYWSTVTPTSEVLLASEQRSQVSRTVTVRGPSLLGQWSSPRVLQWETMRHWPYYTRHFNYASPGKCARINGVTYEHAPVMDYDEFGAPTRPTQPPPPTWRETTAQRIWTAPFSGDQTVGPSLFRTSIPISVSQIWRSHQTMDDRGIGWIGGVPFFKGQEYPSVLWHDTWPETVLLQQSTTYDLVYRVENEFSVPGSSIAWMAHASWALIGPTTAIGPANRIKVSTDAWYGLDCTATPTPGWTPPEVAQQLLDEWQALGYLDNWVIHDANEGEWEEQAEINFEVGRTTGLDALRQLSELADITFDVSDGHKRVIFNAPGGLGDYHLDTTCPRILDREILEHSVVGT